MTRATGGSKKAGATDAGRFYARLKALGCVYCPTCRCYMHVEHVCHDWTCGRVYVAPAVTTVLVGGLESEAA